ncbi:MAG: deoxyribodipyrimidine photolyase [Caldithrix sp. RBG_13_44_9]|nr:MAG: deoxyribodipyrimidine photolyase [Caldithrix sp. RBG_13_44_9]
MSERSKICLFWFRRDLRLEDNSGLFQALRGGFPVLPLFIFDTLILKTLKNKADQRVQFIYNELEQIQDRLCTAGSSLLIQKGEPVEIFKQLIKTWEIEAVFTNHDYEPYALARDGQIDQMLKLQNFPIYTFKDQVIFEKNEVVKSDGTPYTIFTPYKNKWLDAFHGRDIPTFPSEDHFSNFIKTTEFTFPTIEEIGFRKNDQLFPSKKIDLEIIKNYDRTRDYPGIHGTTRLGSHLRFGTVSIRKLVQIARELNSTFLNELIWREFFMMILHHFPKVVEQPFKQGYENIQWMNNDDHFQRWCEGKTGYPIVDAGMRELNTTGFMHNRVRMITASFLAKQLLIDWRWGEQYFAEKLLDFELSSNNGNWQWAAGCGCDAAPYFRVFNPVIQTKKFDPEQKYIKKWVPEYQDDAYPKPIIEHTFARERAITVYSKALRNT